MINAPSVAKCPKCGKVLAVVTVGHIEVQETFGDTRRGISFSCASCQTLLGIQLDPSELKKQITAEVLKKLRCIDESLDQ